MHGGDRRRTFSGRLESISRRRVASTGDCNRPIFVTPKELSERLSNGEELALLDVRELNEHQFVALPNSVHIPLGELPERVGELEALQTRECVVYCHHGIRSLHAIGFLRQCGFEKLHNLSGGIDLWSLEVDSGAPRY